MEFLKYFLAAFLAISLFIAIAWGLAQIVVYLFSINWGWLVILVGFIGFFSTIFASEMVNYNKK